MYDFLIVGAGFAGCILAERIATQLNKKVLIVEKRNHIAGNAYDYYDEHGILVHKYGPHILHSNSNKTINYLNNFTEWHNYQHRVLALVDGKLVPIPINLDTINILYGTRLSKKEVEIFLEQVREKKGSVKNSRDIIIDKIGTELYEKFFKGYTKKQWDLWPEELDSSVCGRIPVRTNRDDRYFTDKYQVMPKYGFTKMFERMLNHNKINVLLQTDYREVIDHVKCEKLIFTGPIDAFFNYKYGHLPYRSLRFEFETFDRDYYQTVGQINYPNDYDFTRITEFKHITGQQHAKTTIVREYSSASGEPYYPIPNPENHEIYKKYKKEAESLHNVFFVGRLATYKYFNMDQVVAQALHVFENNIAK